MKLIVVFLLIFNSPVLLAEIYSDDLEKHEGVLNCRDSSPHKHTGPFYLDRDMLGEPLSIDGLVEALLTLDIERKTAAMEYEFPMDLHESEGTRHELRLAEYFWSSYAHAAKCVSEKYREGDEIRSFYNSGIAPSWQKGFVVLRDGKITVRVITGALYVD